MIVAAIGLVPVGPTFGSGAPATAVIAATSLTVPLPTAARPALLTFAQPKQAAAYALKLMKLRSRLVSVKRWPLLRKDHLDPRLNRLYLLTYGVTKRAPPTIPNTGVYQSFAYVARPRVGVRWHLVRYGTGP